MRFLIFCGILLCCLYCTLASVKRQNQDAKLEGRSLAGKGGKAQSGRTLGKEGQKGRSLAGDKKQAGRTIAGKPQAGRTIAGKPQAGRTIAGKPQAGRTIAGKPQAGRTIAGKPQAGRTIAGKPQAGRTIAGKPQAGRTIGGKGQKGRTIGGRTIGGKGQKGRSLDGLENAENLTPTEMKETMDNVEDNTMDCFRNASAPLELVFLIDQTSSRVLKLAPKILRIVDDLKKKHPGSKFGMSLYGDFQCSDMKTQKQCKLLVSRKQEHNNPDACYTHKVPLSPDGNKLKEAIKKVKKLPGSKVEAGVAGVLLLAADTQMRWGDKPNQPDLNHNRIIFVITDDGTHCCTKKFGTKKQVLGDGTDQCRSMNNPTPEFTGLVLKRKEISLFMVMAKDDSKVDPKKSWKSMAQRMNVSYGEAHMLKDDVSKMAKVFEEFLVKSSYVYGPMPCDKDGKKPVALAPPVGAEEAMGEEGALSSVAGRSLKGKGRSLAAQKGRTIGAQKGRTIGAQKGRTIGAQKGRTIGAQKGRTIGAQKGRTIGAQKGRTIGAQKGRTIKGRSGGDGMEPETLGEGVESPSALVSTRATPGKPILLTIPVQISLTPTGGGGGGCPPTCEDPKTIPPECRGITKVVGGAGLESRADEDLIGQAEDDLEGRAEDDLEEPAEDDLEGRAEDDLEEAAADDLEGRADDELEGRAETNDEKETTDEAEKEGTDQEKGESEISEGDGAESVPGAAEGEESEAESIDGEGGKQSGRSLKGQAGRTLKGQAGRTLKGQAGRTLKGQPAGRTLKGQAGRTLKGQAGRTLKAQPAGRSLKGEQKGRTMGKSDALNQKGRTLGKPEQKGRTFGKPEQKGRTLGKPDQKGRSMAVKPVPKGRSLEKKKKPPGPL